MSGTLPLEIQLNCHFAKFYNKCKSHEFQLVQTIIMVASSNPISPMRTNIKNAHKSWSTLQWMALAQKYDDVNIIRELIDVCENYKPINVLTMCDVDVMIESTCV